MKTYTILWSRQDYGRIEIQAESVEQAREKFEQGNYKDSDLNIKGGEIVAEEVKEY